MSEKVEHVYLEPEEIAVRNLQTLEEAGIRFADKRILDAGCGTGTYSRLLAERQAAYVLGIDIISRNIELARLKNASPKVEYRCVDLLHLETRRRFDLVFARGVVYYFKNLDAVLQRIADLIKPGGELFITFTEKNTISVLGNLLKKIAAIIPLGMRLVFRNFLAMVYYLSVNVIIDRQKWPIIQQKMNTIFYPAEHLMTLREAKTFLARYRFEITKIIINPSKLGICNDFGIWVKKPL